MGNNAGACGYLPDAERRKKHWMFEGGGDILAAPLSALGLTLRSCNALKNNGISTVGDLVARTETELARLPLVGPIVLAGIKARLTAGDGAVA